MKSIMEEASSIAKAIEAAWIRAEKPHEFSVKVFEEPEKNFFGMVTKSAKIGLFFKHVEKKLSYKEQKEHAARHKPTAHPSEQPVFSTHPKESARKESSRYESSPRESREPREYREPREREGREYRESREQHERREPREPRESRETREYREPMVREPREPRESRETREYREPVVREPREREQREPRERSEHREIRERREPREAQERREPREPREAREPREPQERREPMVRELVRREQTPRPAAPAGDYESHQTAPKEREFESAESNAPEKIFWTEEMVEITRAWIDTLVKNLNCGDISFTLEPKRYYLTVSFDKPVRETKALEQQLFRSCAYLIMQMLRTKLKKQFRGLKVVLHSPS